MLKGGRRMVPIAWLMCFRAMIASFSLSPTQSRRALCVYSCDYFCRGRDVFCNGKGFQDIEDNQGLVTPFLWVILGSCHWSSFPCRHFRRWRGWRIREELASCVLTVISLPTFSVGISPENPPSISEPVGERPVLHASEAEAASDIKGWFPASVDLAFKLL